MFCMLCWLCGGRCGCGEKVRPCGWPSRCCLVTRCCGRRFSRHWRRRSLVMYWSAFRLCWRSLDRSSRGPRRPRSWFNARVRWLFFFDRFGMNSNAVDLRKFFFDAVFEGGGYVVDLGDREGASHRAVAGGEDVVFDLADAHVVTVYELVEFGRQSVQEIFDGARELLHFAGA